MAYQVLARKYRPQRFADVAGQDHVTRTLKNALTQQRVAHGYIFSGHRGIGKTTIARILAMALDCRSIVGSPERPDVEPCLQCVSCREISSGGSHEAVTQSFDFIEIDAASNRGIDDVRSICSQATVRPARERYKIFLLDEAHQITDAAFNAILKTLEEPPEWAVFMMATTEPENIPQTIRSRCQHFSFHAVRFDDILSQLRTIAAREDILFEDEALALLAEAGDGSMRDALSIMDQAIASAPRQDGKPLLEAALIRELMGALPNATLERLFEIIAKGESAPLMYELDRLLTSGNSPIAIARQMVRYLRNTLMASLGGENTTLLQIAAEERARAARTALLFSEEELTRNLQLLLRTFDDLGFRQEQRFHLELGLLRLVHAQRLVPMEQILSGLAALPTNSAASAASSTAVRSSASAANPRTASSSAPVHQAPVHQASAAPAASPFAPSGSTSASLTSARMQPASDAASSSVFAELGRIETSAFNATEGALARAVGPQLVQRPSSESAPAPLASVLVPSPEAQDTASVADISAAATSAPTGDTSPDTSPDTSLDAVRTAVVQALESGGHNSAATLLDAAQWIPDGATLRIEVPAKATMIRITFNAAAEKIIRQMLTTSGAPTRYRIVPGESSATVTPRATVSAGSIDHEARNHPLVVQSLEIFDGEICSVIDLRPK